ncbi:hypothetical protein ILUMI_10548 [Ignelater luminosus]|uniref:Uncharacterized protein n=1 Tax=Ignelater luminosus TaxID=2038154 RepID=A0A8K0CXP6_IGNLU|nr:hypothetical protein ILUMI_10548 [Ignelater luminosus]
MQEENIQLIEAIDAILQTKAEALDIMTKRLLLLSRHSAFSLLCASISIPRLIYFLSCSPTWRRMSLLEKYDIMLKSSLESILNISLSRDAWLQSFLPVKMGGLGIDTLLTWLPPDIFFNTTTIIAEAQKFWETSCHAEEILAGSVCCIQSVWEASVNQHTLFDLTISTNTAEDKARVLAATSGSWLNALPSPQLGTHMSGETFRTSVAIRLGADVSQPHRCPCDAAVSANGLPVN